MLKSAEKCSEFRKQKESSGGYADSVTGLQLLSFVSSLASVAAVGLAGHDSRPPVADQQHCQHCVPVSELGASADTAC